MIEKENVIDILEKTKKAIQEEDIVLLRELSNKTIHSATISQDTENISIAIIVYSLSKILERKNFREYKEWDVFINNYSKYINNSLKSLKQNNLIKFRENLQQIRKLVGKISGNFKKHIQDVFRKASINKASRIYEHGISMEQTAKLLGISIWELAEYAGQTGVSDVNLNLTTDVKKRIKLAMDFFK